MYKTFLDGNLNYSYLSNDDLKSFLSFISNYYIEYRENIGLSSKLTFGLEIEYEGIEKEIVDEYVKINLKRWINEDEVDLNKGGEIVSPILTDNSKDWDELLLICKYLQKNNADTFHNAGGHIHVGANILGSDVESWRIFLKLYMLYENVVFRFAYGDKANARKKILLYAQPVRDKIYELLNYINDEKDIKNFERIKFENKKYLSLNLINVDFKNPSSTEYKKTIEFRCPNASIDACIWQNNVNTFSKMLISSMSKTVDEDFLDYKIKHEYISYNRNKQTYNNICLKDVLEFVDLVFNNNLDKINFLRQYLKNFENNIMKDTLVPTKIFTRTK